MPQTRTPELRARKGLYAQRHYQKLRDAAFDHYGHACHCCGEDRQEFLAFDHIHGGGKKHRAEIRATLVQWFKRTGYPPGFRTLCHNCNNALAHHGYCPHQTAAMKEAV